jgi:hypothetical protein
MRPALLPTALLAALATCAQSGSGLSEREQERIIKNRIMSVTVASSNYEDGEPVEPHYWWHQVFDRKGRLIRSTERHEWEPIGTIMQCDTDAQGRMTRCLQQQFGVSGQVEHANETFLDPSGQPVRMISYESGEIEELYVYTYGEHGLILEEMMLPDSTVVYTTSHAYDALGNHIEDVGMTSDVDSAGHRFFYLDRRYHYTYDAHGHELERAYSTGQGLLGRCYSRYDGQGNLLEYRVCEPDGTERSRQSFTYDKRGNRVEFRNEAPGTIMMREVTTYDKKGNPIQSIHYRGPDPDYVNQYTYEYHPQ